MPLTPDRAYRILGVAPGAKPEEVKIAYRDLAQVWHPDRFPAGSRLHQKAERNLKRINQAYALLKDYQPPAQPARSQLRDSIAAVIELGDVRESGAFQAGGPWLRRTRQILGLDQLPNEPRPNPKWRVVAVLLLGGAVLLVLWYWWTTPPGSPPL